MTVSDKLVIKQNGADRTLFMSFGLLNELVKNAGSVEAVALFAVDPETSRIIRSAILAERKGGGKIVQPVDDPDEIDVSVEDTERMLKWAVDHTLGFYVRQMTMVAKATDAVKDQLTPLAPVEAPVLTSSPNGSNAST